MFLAIKKEVATKIDKGKNLLPLSWFMKEIKRGSSICLNASNSVIEENDDDILNKCKVC